MYKIAMLLGLLVAVMNVSALGAGFMGTPTAELEQGQWSVGFNYTYIDMDLDKTKMKGSTVEVGEVTDEDGDLIFPFDEVDSYSFKFEIEDVKTQRYYGTIGYGITDVWEAYVQLGIADVKAKVREDGPEDEWSGINLDNDFAWGWGTRYTFYEQDNVRWGASLQMNWIDTSWDDKAVYEESDVIGGDLYVGEQLEDIQIDWESYDLLFAVGPTVDMGGWSLYGGPFYYMQKGDLDLKINETTSISGGTPVINISSEETTKESGDLEADSFGGFVGAQCTMMDNYNLTAEISFTGDGWGIGAGVCYAF